MNDPFLPQFTNINFLENKKCTKSQLQLYKSSNNETGVMTKAVVALKK